LAAHDLAAAKVALSRLTAFMPMDSAVTPAPANPLERALADLWSRTAPTMSADWRWQFSGGMQKFFEGCFWELENISGRRVPDPIDYVEMRRHADATECSALLSRSAIDLEIPSDILRTRPMRTVLATFGDWAGLSNDIFSYAREIGDEGEINNSVLVVERFLGCDAQHAVKAVNDLVTARLRQFEDTVTIALPELFDELCLDAHTRRKVMKYIAGLQDWMAGALHWHMRSSRYAHDRWPEEFRLRQLLRGTGRRNTSAIRVESRRPRGVTGSARDLQDSWRTGGALGATG
jgi:germacradienol/geosmin synthase